MATLTRLEVPVDDTVTIQNLTQDPYPIYTRFRHESPVIKVKSVNRILLTKATETKYVKDNPALFSSDDPNTPMQRAFRAHTLMRKDGEAHSRERNAMASAFGGRSIKQCWEPIYRQIAQDYVAKLPRGEIIDLFPTLAGPFAARCLTHLLGITEASDEDMQRWSQVLIDGAGNFGWQDALFAPCDAANDEMDALFKRKSDEYVKSPNNSALSVMVNAETPIPESQIFANIKIAIGGGINEPRDALLTILFGLLTNPDQKEAALKDGLWGKAFEEGVRWVAPIQVSSRLVTEDTEIRGYFIPKGEVVMTSQASANWDEDVVTDGHEFNMFRDRIDHQSFGNGPHFCQGKHVARRMIADIMLPTLFDRFPNMRIPDPKQVDFYGFGFRGPRNLPVILE